MGTRVTRVGRSVAVTLPGVGDAVQFTRCDQATANRLLEDWGHYLGPCLRPFGIEPWLLVLDEPIGVAVGASSAGATCGPWARQQVVELARLCTRPGANWSTRVTLRLWREVAAPRWPHWQVLAAVAYSQDMRHDGRIYRFDGWRRVAGGLGSSGNGQWTKPRGTDHPARGPKTLWAWEYDGARAD